LGHIFINKSLGQEDISEITRHEKSHLGQYHFLDVLFIKIVQMVQWFNPVIYLFNRSLRIVHEYQADLDCLRTGLPVIKYLNLLFCHAFKTQKFKLNNSFSNPSLIKKRMIMMTKKRTITLANFKILIVLPVTILLLVFISSCRISGKLSATKSEIAPPPPPPPPPEIFVVVEEMPTFPGGEQALMEFIYANIQYPEMAKKNNIQGKEIIRFAVMADGYVDYVQVLKSVDPELDKEAIRVIKMLPVWTPGKQGGKPVNVWYNVPVTFQLK
jgi:TonB family protein